MSYNCRCFLWLFFPLENKVIPVISPRQRWGCLLDPVTTRSLSPSWRAGGLVWGWRGEALQSCSRCCRQLAGWFRTSVCPSGKWRLYWMLGELRWVGSQSQRSRRTWKEQLSGAESARQVGHTGGLGISTGDGPPLLTQDPAGKGPQCLPPTRLFRAPAALGDFP